MNLSKALEDDFKTGSYDGSPGATPFDDVFKTEVVRLREFLIPLINELYGESYEIELIDLKREANEHYYVESDAGIKHRISDSCLRIGGKLYHVECQSTVDGNILFRLVEYNMQIGLSYHIGSKRLTTFLFVISVGSKNLPMPLSHRSRV